MRMSRLSLLLLFAAVLVLGFARVGLGAQQRLPLAVRAALKGAHLPVSSVGILVQDVSKGGPVLAYNAGRAMSPASTMKLLTTYGALELLGPAYRWKTEVYVDGPLSGGVLDGDLIVKGYGDPDLTLERFWLLLRGLRQQGLREIRGDLVLDESFFAPANGDPGAFDNRPYRPYNAVPRALLVNFNAVRLRFLPQDAGDVRVVADPVPQGLRLTDGLRPVEGSCGDWRSALGMEVRSRPGGAELDLKGHYPAACGEQDLYLSLLGNGAYVYGVFKQLWSELGGAIKGGYRSGPVPPSARLLETFQSPPLADIVRDINKFSNNVMARQLFLTIGAEQGGPPGTVDKAAEAIRAWLAAKGLDFPELALGNGSGLSRNARISPRHLGALLLAAYRSPVFSELESSLPIASVDGTMKKRLKDQPVAGHAHIKTGTLEGVKTLAGYVFDRKGRRMVVVCMINHPDAAAGKAAQDALLEWVFGRP